MAGLLLWGAPALAQQAPPREPPREPPLQIDPAPADTVPGDSLAGTSIVPVPAPPAATRDSVKAPFAVAERPGSPELRGRQFVWDRATIFASGALTLADLIAEVPGTHLMTSGFLTAPTAMAYFGEPGRVRVFFDGIEMDPLDPRLGGSVDLTTLPLWALEEVAVERAAGELRVHLRSWRVQLTTAQTRTDVATGADNLNVYRGYYGKRFNNGAGLQLGGQYHSTTNQLVRGDGDALGFIGRFGVARPSWSVDAVAARLGRSRNATRRYVRAGAPVDGAIPAFDGRDVTAYLRAAFRDPDRGGFWAQAIAATVQSIEDDSLARSTDTPDADSVVTQSQWTVATGYTAGGLRLSATGRLRTQGGASRFAPALRASWDTRVLALSAFAEEGGPDSTRRVDVLARVQLLPWVYAAGGASLHAPANEAAQGPERTTTRGELGLTWRGRWISAGVVNRSAATVAGFPVFDANYATAAIGPSTAMVYGLGGPIWGPFSLDWRIHDWGDEALYRPKVQSRAALRVATSLRRWLKRDTFFLRAAIVHEYRSDLRAPDGVGGVQLAKGASAYTSQLDVRIGTAHLFWHNRNMTGMVYETVPGYLMPRLAQFYGIRWEFWN